MNGDPQLSAYKAALISTTRALTAKQSVTVDFPGAATKPDIMLPAFAEMPSGEALPFIRGQADQAALSLRYHSATEHEKIRPSSKAESTVFDLLENIRVETLGGTDMAGVRYNLAKRYERECMQKNLHPESMSALNLLELQARRHIQQLPVPAFLSRALEKAEKEMPGAIPVMRKMQALVDNQTKFALPASEPEKPNRSSARRV